MRPKTTQGAKTLRAHVRGWVRFMIEGANEVDAPALAKEGRRVMADDAEFCEAFLDEFLYSVVYDVIQQELAYRRSSVDRQLKGLTSGAGKRRMKASALADAIEASVDEVEWGRWMEYDPTSGITISLLAMTKEQANAAAAAREERGDVDYRRAAMLRVAAGRCADGQRIGDVWTTEGLTAVEREITMDRPTYRFAGQSFMDMVNAARTEA